MNNRIDRVIGELVELVDRVMGTRQLVPWPTTSQKSPHHTAQVTAAPDHAMEGDVYGLRLSKPEGSKYSGGDLRRLEL